MCSSDLIKLSVPPACARIDMLDNRASGADSNGAARAATTARRRASRGIERGSRDSVECGATEIESSSVPLTVKVSDLNPVFRSVNSGVEVRSVRRVAGVKIQPADETCPRMLRWVLQLRRSVRSAPAAVRSQCGFSTVRCIRRSPGSRGCLLSARAGCASLATLEGSADFLFRPKMAGAVVRDGQGPAMIRWLASALQVDRKSTRLNSSH